MLPHREKKTLLTRDITPLCHSADDFITNKHITVPTELRSCKLIINNLHGKTQSNTQNLDYSARLRVLTWFDITPQSLQL